MKRLIVSIGLFMVLVAAAGAMPASYNDDKEGWIGVYGVVGKPFDSDRFFAGFEIQGAGPENTGFGFNLLIGSITGLSFNLIYFANPGDIERVSIPLTLRVGFFMDNKNDADSGFGISLSTGLKLFLLGGTHNAEDNESMWLDGEGRLSAFLFGLGIHPVMEGLFGGSMSLRPERGGYYVVYY